MFPVKMCQSQGTYISLWLGLCKTWTPGDLGHWFLPRPSVAWAAIRLQGLVGWAIRICCVQKAPNFSGLGGEAVRESHTVCAGEEHNYPIEDFPMVNKGN